MKKKIKSDEIDLLEIIINLWKNKIKIAVITVIFISLPIAQYFTNEPLLKAKTEILPITRYESNYYEQYNTFISQNNFNVTSQNRLKEISKDYILRLFIEELRTKDVIIEAIKKYQLIDQKNFDSEYEYLKAVERKALKAVLLNPRNSNDKIKNETKLNWIIEFEVYDKDKWEKALSFIEIEANKNVKNYLKFNFDTTYNNLKLLEQFKIEDINLKIDDVKKDYEIEANNKIAFLKEQVLIARTLNIENNTFEVESFITQPYGVISNLQSAKPYYMRGYAMIEKEIELIETRTNKDAFTNNLLSLEKQKRNLLEDKSLERIEKLFNSTPIATGINFKVAEITYKDTRFYDSSSNSIKSILFAGIFGIIFGMFYVQVSNAIQQRK
jgi:LPS O-antigen subunit length determinant protein (WzzB/FepE family)